MFRKIHTVILVFLLELTACDNFHSFANENIVCNGVPIITDIQHTNSRWKISYLGIRENIHIKLCNNTVYIEGVKKTTHKEHATKETIYFPQGYELVLHRDKLYKNTLPQKVGVMSVTLALSTILCIPSFKWIAQIFK